MLLTITGPSASGKSSLAHAIQDIRGDAQILPSVTTRPARKSDRPGEYRFETLDTFAALEKAGAFAWTVEAHGHRYGTLKEDIARAVNTPGVVMAVVVVEGVKNLHAYLNKVHAGAKIASIYLDHTSEELLRSRLLKRGDDPADIERRIMECRTWAQERDESGVPFIIKNASTESAPLAKEVLTELNI